MLAYISFATISDRKTACSAVSHEELWARILRLSAWLDNFAHVLWRRESVSNAQYTLTPTRLNCRVESSWVVSAVCTRPSAVVTQFTILQRICDCRRKLETGSRLTTGAFTPPTRLNSTVELRRRRRCVLGYIYICCIKADVNVKL